MSYVKGLRLKKVDRPSALVAAGHNPMERIREKMLAAIDIQVRLVNAEQRKKEISVKGRRPRKWYFKVGDNYYVGVKYGNRNLPVARKIHTIEAGTSLANVRTVLGTLRSAVEAGELDEQLLKLASTMGRKKKKRSA